MKKMFRPSIAYFRQFFKRKPKRNDKKRTNTTAARPATANTAVTTTTTSAGSYIPPDSNECYDRGPVWRSWSLVHSSSSSSSEKGGEAEAQGGEQQSPLAQNARCAANKNKNKHMVSQTIEAWWMDPYLIGTHHPSWTTVAGVVRGSSRRGRVVQGEGAWWTEQR